MPTRTYPEPTLLEVLEKLEIIEELTTLGKWTEPRAIKAKELQEPTKTTLILIWVISAAETLSELLIEGKRRANFSTSKEGSQEPITAIVPANKTWEIVTFAGAPEYKVAELTIGGIGTQGPAGGPGAEGKEGKEGKIGPEGKEGPAGELTATNVGEKGNFLEWVSKTKGIWKSLKSAIELISFNALQTEELKVVKLFLTGGSFKLEKEGFFLGPGGGIEQYTIPENETLNIFEKKQLNQNNVIALKTTAERTLYGARSGPTPGRIYIFLNVSTFNIIFENESTLEELGKKPENENEQFIFSIKENITLKPGELLFIYNLGFLLGGGTGTAWKDFTNYREARAFPSVTPEALKEETGAEKELTPSATKMAIVVVTAKVKAATEINYTIEVDGKAVASLKKGVTDLAEEVAVGTFYVAPGKVLKFKKTAGEVEKFLISITLIN